eukprot:2457417-Rhodomonas_salina.3
MGYTWARGPCIQLTGPSPQGPTGSNSLGLTAPPSLRYHDGCCHQHRGGRPCLSPIGLGITGQGSPFPQGALLSERTADTCQPFQGLTISLALQLTLVSSPCSAHSRLQIPACWVQVPPSQGGHNKHTLSGYAACASQPMLQPHLLRGVFQLLRLSALAPARCFMLSCLLGGWVWTKESMHEMRCNTEHHMNASGVNVWKGKFQNGLGRLTDMAW